MNKITQFLGAAAVVIIALVFILQFRPASQQNIKDDSPRCAAEIQGDCISASHFWAEYRLLAPRGADAEQLRAMGHRRRTVDGLIERWLLNEDAKRLGITVSDDDVTEALANGRAFVSVPVSEGPPNNLHDNYVRFLNVKNRQTKKFDSKGYDREVRTATQLSPTEFREFQKQEMIAARMRDLIRSRAHVGEAEAFTLYSREKSTATLSYVKFDNRFYEDVVIDASAKNVEAWAEKNKEEIDKVWESRKEQHLPECRVARQITVSLEGSDDDKAEARKKIDAALERIKKGDDFAEVAKSVSQDEATARKGGELGCVGKGTQPKPVEEALFALEEGKVSEVVETADSLRLLKVEKIAKEAEAEKIGRLEAARDLYMKHESERLAAEGAKQVLAAARSGKTLDEAVKAYLDGLTPPAKDDKADAKKKGDKAAAKKDDKAGEKKDEEPAAEKKDEGPAEVTIANHPNRPVVESTLAFNITGDPISDVRPGQEVARTAFELEKPGDVPNDIVPLRNGYAVVQLKEKAPASKEQWDKDREDYIRLMRQQKEHDALISYVRRLRTTLANEIKITPSFLTEPKVKGEESEPMPEDQPIEE